ncbi:ABC transporter permease [Corynebacterium kroppenstedtii]|uniref:Transport permease protein n=1 Tax=Corynebacterium kroppenstedtii (strain DSM 44385 / JCM 11950 / CIP 105744 / CCUG 35717) TaxID=645127 RepID=C4LK37_CORK4|nr:ABC transporter permease [Corynebacterium kroppenstedtii]ACR18192.1 ABC-type transport system, permease protein [Corynebacterium kroppenstedtii DSM 44385]QRP10444.1 ABC transporter permease [Corynebacterium kroppenstedtii]
MATKTTANQLASFRRIMMQLRSDKPTIALLVVVPPALLTLLYFVYDDQTANPGSRKIFASIGPVMLAILPMVLMFIVTSVAMLRERKNGTLERVLCTPLQKWNLIGSYALVFSFFSLIQASVLTWLLLEVFDVPIQGQWHNLLLLAALNAIVGVAFGLLASAFARSEFQAVQFVPLFIAPQIFLCGLLVPVAHMPGVLEGVAKLLPMTWAVDVVKDIVANPELSDASWSNLWGLLALSVIVLVIAALTMPRRTR